MTVDEALTYSESFDPATIDRGGSIQEAFLELAAEVRRLRAIQAGKVVDALYERANRVDFRPAFDERSAVVAYLGKRAEAIELSPYDQTAEVERLREAADDILKGEHLK